MRAALWREQGDWDHTELRGSSAILVLTLDINGDGGLLPAGNGFVGGAADDALPILNVRGGDEQGAHDALPLAITEKCLWGEKQG